jgi:bifunctional DNA-binding transcriptional regulator/antitoxin component of YhaV-PrlF toxin-antitoxin module
MATEIIVGKRGRITIPARVRKKYRIEGRIKIIATAEGLLLQSKDSKSMGVILGHDRIILGLCYGGLMDKLSGYGIFTESTQLFTTKSSSKKRSQPILTSITAQILS